MFSLRVVSRRPLMTFAVAGGAGAYLLSHAGRNRRDGNVKCDAQTVTGAGFKAVAERLGPYVRDMERSAKIVFRTEKDKVKVYGIADEAGHVATGGLPVVRVAQAVIKAPVDEVALCWWQASRRKEWDSINTQDSQMVRSLSPTSRLVYLQAKPKRGGIVSSRDFCYVMHRPPPELLGARPGSILFVQTNSAEDVPPSKSSTRGDVNSLLLLEPLDPMTTKAYYAVEMDVKGWLPVRVVKAAADEMPLTLAVMRDHLEKELDEEAALSPEAAAKHAVHRREGEQSGEEGIAGAWATKKDLLETKHLLETQLKKVAADERKMGLDLSALRRKIKQELADLEKRL